jgi:hypothetical protein
MKYFFLSFILLFQISLSASDYTYTQDRFYGNYSDDTYYDDFNGANYGLVPASYVLTDFFFNNHPVYSFDGGFYIRRNGLFQFVTLNQWELFKPTHRYINGHRVFKHRGHFFIRKHGRFIPLERHVEVITYEPTTYYYNSYPVYMHNGDYYYLQRGKYYKFHRPASHKIYNRPIIRERHIVPSNRKKVKRKELYNNSDASYRRNDISSGSYSNYKRVF